MPARADILDLIRKAIAGQAAQRELGGTFTERSLADLQRLSPLPDNPAYITRHGLSERHFKDKWTPEEIAEAYTKILGSERTRGVPNPLLPGRRATEALWLPEGQRSLYSPVDYLSGGHTQLRTIYDPPTDRIRNDLDAFIRSPSSGLNKEQKQLASDILKNSRWAVSGMATGGLLAMLGAEDAQAGATAPAQESAVPSLWESLSLDASFDDNGHPFEPDAWKLALDDSILPFGLTPLDVGLAFTGPGSLGFRAATLAATPFVNKGLDMAGDAISPYLWEMLN